MPQESSRRIENSSITFASSVISFYFTNFNIIVDSLSDVQKDAVAGVLKREVFTKGQEIVCEG